jgi:hypothetical protein
MNRRPKSSELRTTSTKRRLQVAERREATGEDTATLDHRLVKRCVSGEVAAWEELYGRFHESLCRAIAGMLGSGSADASRVDEIAARVWYALVRDDGELLARFDPLRHTRFSGFLRGLARVEIMQYYRAEYRRRAQEAASVRHSNISAPFSDWQVTAMIDDFASTLTDGEQEFLEDHLLGSSEEGQRRWSNTTIWQRCHRIREKLKAFFVGNG